MYLETTLEGLNAFIKATFSEQAVPHLKLNVEITAPNPRSFAKTYPAGLPEEERPIYDEAFKILELGENKIQAIKGVREVSAKYRLIQTETLKGGKDFVERWFPGHV